MKLLWFVAALVCLIIAVLVRRQPEAPAIRVIGSGPRQPDGVIQDPLRKLAFGSCAKPHLPSVIWDAIGAEEADAWLWMGDAGYPNCTLPACVSSSYDAMRNNHEYSKFISQGLPLGIYGVWDDHDFGYNDGGGDYVHKYDTIPLWRKFIGPTSKYVPPEREGMYFSVTFGDVPNKVKLIVLDTRFNRDPMYVPNISEFSSVAAALLRSTQAFLGLGSDHPAEILGYRQREWLEGQISESDASIHIVVSSIQVLTGVPTFESWGLFPRAQQNLFEILKIYKPRGLIFLSGDVHLAQIMGDLDGVLEVTSSGLTHTVLSSGLQGSILLEGIIPLYSRNTIIPESTNKRYAKVGAVYEGRNYGILEIDGNEHVSTVRVGIKDLDGKEVFFVRQNFTRDEDVDVRMNLVSATPGVVAQGVRWYGFILRCLIVILCVAIPMQVVYIVVHANVVRLKRMVYG